MLKINFGNNSIKQKFLRNENIEKEIVNNGDKNYFDEIECSPRNSFEINNYFLNKDLITSTCEALNLTFCYLFIDDANENMYYLTNTTGNTREVKYEGSWNKVNDPSLTTFRECTPLVDEVDVFVRLVIS